MPKQRPSNRTRARHTARNAEHHDTRRKAWRNVIESEISQRKQLATSNYNTERPIGPTPMSDASNKRSRRPHSAATKPHEPYPTIVLQEAPTVAGAMWALRPGTSGDCKICYIS